MHVSQFLSALDGNSSLWQEIDTGHLAPGLHLPSESPVAAAAGTAGTEASSPPQSKSKDSEGQIDGASALPRLLALWNAVYPFVPLSLLVDDGNLDGSCTLAGVFAASIAAGLVRCLPLLLPALPSSLRVSLHGVSVAMMHARSLLIRPDCSAVAAADERLLDVASRFLFNASEAFAEDPALLQGVCSLSAPSLVSCGLLCSLHSAVAASCPCPISNACVALLVYSACRGV